MVMRSYLSGQLIGPLAGFDTGKWLRWYSAPYPDGQKISPSTEAGSIFGPVEAIYHTEPRGKRPGYVSCMVPNPFFVGDPQHCFVDWSGQGGAKTFKTLWAKCRTP